ncbi:nibrin isoform X2 [Pseudoliparis swirei]|uniref:nibrin isoform X2 n=1 Tax=Pseudoliparis swirei TaxID=2059687 RepID=UPI0024BDE24B|nr:nibrin isoform X2 [Pseudoliparis swirei]
MWILAPLEPGGETHYLLSSKEYVVGRKNCDIVLPNDQSISRAHAHLTAADQTLTLKDTSKYGSFVNSQQLTQNTPVNLKSGDNVTFGVFNSKFSVDHQKPVVCSSCLDNEGKASLSQALSALGGKLINTWTHECTHLAMPSMKVTIKTISALLCCCPIVKPEFFMEFSKAAQQKLPPPKAERFVPEIDEPSLSKEDVNLGAIPVRKQLFSGKTFIFLNAKQLKRLSRAVDFGGGKSQLLEDGALPRGLLESPQSCVVNVMTDSSQTLLPPSTTEWANSVKNIVQRKGLRVITESEIGLAAIYASCVKYCNPSNLTPDSVLELAPKVEPRIPGASLSQSVAVEETVLPAASQNITAYAVNTEPSQGTELCEGTGLMAVGETPERKQNQNRSQLLGSRPVAMETTTQYIVADTMNSSFNTVENTDSQRKKPTVSGAGSGDIKSQPALPRTNVGMKTFLPKLSSQKRKISAQASPQSTLTTFFQTANKKRPLEEEPFSFMSEPKRPALDTDAKQTPNTSARSNEASSCSDRAPVAICQTPLGSTADLFVGRSEAQPNRVSHAVHEEPCSRKRKEMEAEIQMDELEALMSEDMDFLDEQPSGNQGQQAQLETLKSTEQKLSLNTVAASSSSKRQRVQLEEHVKNQKPQVGLGKEKKQTSGQHIVTIKTEQVDPVEYKTTNKGSSTRPEVSSASTSKDIQPFEDDDSSFIEDVELLKVDMCQPKTPLQPVALKLEVQESTIDEDLPRKLLLVEFRSLTVTVPPKTKPQRMQNNTKNFKCFRKICVPGVEGSPRIIRGSDLLVHSRGKNTDLDEWLKDAVEDERQSKRDQSIGEDLFRYNPSKLTRRR